MPQISVIVPVYNVENYLSRCIDSILAQTFEDFELILVDDGSLDRCPEICDKYVERDVRIHVIHQEYSGVSAARNTGVDWAFANSDSQWLSFVDSDDWIHPGLLETLYKTAIKTQVAISACRYESTDGENPHVSTIHKYQLWTPEDFFVQHNANAIVVWGKLYKKECFSYLRFPVGKIHEDEFITHKILFKYKEIAVIDAPLYAYFYNPKGIMKSQWTPARLDGIEARLEQIEYFESHHFNKAKLRTAKTLLWLIEDQLTTVEKLKIKKTAVGLRKLLKKEMKKYKRILDLSPDRTSYLYEAAYPKLMRIYWYSIALLKKVHFIK